MTVGEDGDEWDEDNEKVEREDEVDDEGRELMTGEEDEPEEGRDEGSWSNSDR